MSMKWKLYLNEQKYGKEFWRKKYFVFLEVSYKKYIKYNKNTKTFAKSFKSQNLIRVKY